MSRIFPVTFAISHGKSFSTNTSWHYVYKSMWKPKNDEKWNCHKYDHHKASMYDNHAIGLYKKEKYFN